MKFWKIYGIFAWVIIFVIAFYRAGENALSSKCSDYCDEIVEFDKVYKGDSDEAEQEFTDAYAEWFDCNQNCKENNLVGVSYLNPLNFKYWMYPHKLFNW